MGAYFIDSSALVKRYVREVGTDWVRRLTHRKPRNAIYVARITAVEVTSAIARRRKGAVLTPTRAASMLYRFRSHLTARYSIIEITPALLTAATKLANSHALRACDAVQLAVAIEVDRIYQSRGSGPVTLVSADQALNAAAAAEGMLVEDPKDHP
jgi:predicted nucleic acid-binding protein